mgnify:FL=1
MGMESVVIGTKSFENGNGQKTLNHLLTCLYSIDIDFLRSFPNTPKLYDSGIRYKEEPLGQERWNDIPTVMSRGIGDCEDLACWRSAELVMQGIAAVPKWLLREVGQFRIYHIVVLHPNGVIEDPSYKLGMSPAFNVQSPFQWRE